MRQGEDLLSLTSDRLIGMSSRRDSMNSGAISRSLSRSQPRSQQPQQHQH
jgi:hypothetical protein